MIHKAIKIHGINHRVTFVYVMHVENNRLRDTGQLKQQGVSEKI